MGTSGKLSLVAPSATAAAGLHATRRFRPQTATLIHGPSRLRVGEQEVTRCRAHRRSAMRGTIQKAVAPSIKEPAEPKSPLFSSTHSRRLVSLQQWNTSPPLASLSDAIPAVDERGELPYRIVGGKKFYLDELDVAGLLDGLTYLRPFNAGSYTPGTYLWKKIADIHPQRRHRLLNLLEPRHIEAMWTAAEDSLDAVESTSGTLVLTAEEMLPSPTRSQPLNPEIWDGLVSGLPGPWKPLSLFRMAFFVGRDGRRYGRTIVGGGGLAESLAGVLAPLYFEVEPARSVLATEDAAQLALAYGDGQLQLNLPGSLPSTFPPARPHIAKFDDDMRHYLRPAGPGVLVGQTWQEGRPLGSIPMKVFGEFVLVFRQTAP